MNMYTNVVGVREDLKNVCYAVIVGQYSAIETVFGHQEHMERMFVMSALYGRGG